jgi:chromosome segregation ATPase
MSVDDQARLDGELAAAEADVTRLRAENGKLADAFRAEPTDAGKEQLKRAAASLAAARDRVGTAKAALAVFEKTGSLHGLVADNGKVTGTVAVTVKGGSTREEREAAVEAALTEQLHAIADELGVVLAAKPSSFTRERPGRDAEGRTVLEVAGRVEGGRLMPAVSKAAKHMRN